MTKNELTKGKRTWCWWKSRYLFFTGRTGADPITKEKTFRFEDICGAITDITEKQLTKLEAR